MNKIILETINIEPILKAQKRFHEFTILLETDLQKTAAIKAFEYCFELSWKTLKKVLKAQGAPDVQFSKDIYRQAAQGNLIEDPELWFEFIKMRNITSHTYNEETLKEIVALFPQFRKAFDSLIKNLLKIT